MAALWIRFLVLIVAAEARFTRRCNVKDSMTVHPERPRAAPPGYHFISSFTSRLMSRFKVNRDVNAFAALFDRKMKCQEQILIPVAWHVLLSSDGTGNVIMATVDKQMQVLNDAYQNAGFYFKL
ncbi:uncharacterized protein LOC114576599, partial [Exaiptasia diaphana]|uniref:Uncharacterized protein n=1 Tax=Exaiptasia diaphana TaxID=2652724 RepID=A0A913YY24_EXADI